MRHVTLAFILALLAACGGSETPAPSPEPPPPQPDPGTPPPPDDGAGGEASGRMCGGIGAIRCPEGEWCDIGATHPDASGTCRAQGTCTDASDCEGQGIVHIQCVGTWSCTAGRCAFECTPG